MARGRGIRRSGCARLRLAREAVVSSGCGGVIVWRLGEVACGPRGRRVWNALEESTKKKAEEEEIRGWDETGCEAGPYLYMVRAVSVYGSACSPRFGGGVRACSCRATAGT